MNRNLAKVLQIAWREFTATVLTKAFLLGILMVPLMAGLAVLLVPWIAKQEQSVAFEGTLLVLDRSGRVADGLEAWLAPSAFEARRRETMQRLDGLVQGALPAGAPAAVPAGIADGAMAEALGPVPRIRVERLPAGSDDAEARARLRGTGPDAPFGVVVVASGALSAGTEPYTLNVREAVDDRVVDAVREGLRDALVRARLAQRGLDADAVRALLRVDRAPVVRLGADGEESRSEILSRLLPTVFMLLLFLAAITGGQMLMTSTIEEKSSRVVELLLAAVSPMQLMAGKILGQGAVALLMLGVYGAVGMAGLAAAAAIGLLEPALLAWLVVFFLIAYVTLAALMAAIGAAVNEIREAQSLLVPVMLAMSLPMMLNVPLARDPNGTLATVLSLVPPISPMVMVLRLSSNTPPPGWQVALSVVLGLVGVALAVWLAAKVFRIGLLMHGKPPDLRTLWRWIRMS
ncbi:MAG: ABC transporter permease [Lysobacteraceae bacterium]